MDNIFLALGTNIEPRIEYLSQALKKLDEHEQLSIVKKSSLYETLPVGYTDQDNFLNMVIEVETTLSPYELLDFCQAIENQLGRKRIIRFGPRTIDVDILLYQNQIIDRERLTVPHPRMHERGFVLIPLQEIAPKLIVPKLNLSVDQLVEKLPEDQHQGIKKYHQSF